MICLFHKASLPLFAEARLEARLILYHIFALIAENSLLRGRRGLWYTCARLRKKDMMNTFKFAWFYYFGFTAGAARAC